MLFLIVASSLLPVYGSEGAWTSVRSKNFYLAGDAGEAEIRAAASRLEEFRQVFRQIFPSLKLDVPGVPSNVVVFKNAASYRPFKLKRSDGTADEAIAGYFQAGEGANYITLSLADAAAESYGTLLHEYVHFLVSTNDGKDEMPAWLNEGLAEYFETLRVNGRTISAGGIRTDHLKLLNSSELLPLSELLQMDNLSLHGGADKKRSIFYAESWAIVHVLMQRLKEADGSMGENIRATIAGNSNSDSAIRSIFGSTDAEFEKGLRAFIVQPPAPNFTFQFPAPVDVGPLTAQPVSDPEANAYLADLLYYSNRDAEAAEYVRKALSANPKLSTAHGTLGLIKMREEKFAEAKKHLEIAAAAEDANAFVVFNHAYSMIRSAMNSKGELYGFEEKQRLSIESALERAIKRNPEFAESYRMLAFVKFVAGKNLDEAATLVRKAAALDPANDEHRLLLAQIYLGQEKYSDARAIADKLESLAADGRIRAEARQVVAAVQEYLSATGAPPKNQITIAAGQLPPLILNRSAVTDAEVEAYELDRQVTNLNRILPRLMQGEQQIAAHIERMRCFADRIEYSINAGGQRTTFVNKEFSDLRLSVITDGERTFQMECGGGFGKQLTVLRFRAPKPGSAMPELTAVTFVPDIFRFKTAEEMARARVVVIIDDSKYRKKN